MIVYSAKLQEELQHDRNIKFAIGCEKSIRKYGNVACVAKIIPENFGCICRESERIE